jgi:hypothetical protein
MQTRDNWRAREKAAAGSDLTAWYGPAAMTDAALPETADRPTWRISFRLLVSVTLGLALIALVAGRYVYARYGAYTPLALAHVPTTMRYRARVELGDQTRIEALRPLLNALDPRGTRLPALEQKLGVSARPAAHELAFGVGPDPFDFVVVLGLQLQAGTGLPPAQALCEVLSAEGIHTESTKPADGAIAGCRFGEGGLVAGTPDGAVVVASRAELAKGLLGMPDIGDRLGFSGPSERGAAPEISELEREASTLAQRVSAKYP